MKIITAFMVLFISLWIWNLVKFVNCDFESDVKCEVIHGVGVFIPPASFIAVWFDDDEKRVENNE